MLILSASISSYCAAVALYQSHKKRALPLVVNRIGLQNLHYLMIVGFALLIGALAACVASLGITRGISVWLGLVSASGLISLIWATLRPASHVLSIVFVVGILFIVNALRIWL